MRTLGLMVLFVTACEVGGAPAHHAASPSGKADSVGDSTGDSAGPIAPPVTVTAAWWCDDGSCDRVEVQEQLACTFSGGQVTCAASPILNFQIPGTIDGDGDVSAQFDFDTFDARLTAEALEIQTLEQHSGGSHDAIVGPVTVPLAAPAPPSPTPCPTPSPVPAAPPASCADVSCADGSGCVNGSCVPWQTGWGTVSAGVDAQLPVTEKYNLCNHLTDRISDYQDQTTETLHCDLSGAAPDQLSIACSLPTHYVSVAPKAVTVSSNGHFSNTYSDGTEGTNSSWESLWGRVIEGHLEPNGGIVFDAVWEDYEYRGGFEGQCTEGDVVELYYHLHSIGVTTANVSR